MTFYHIIEESNGLSAWHGCSVNHTEAQATLERMQHFFPEITFYLHESETDQEPEFITV
jgi:hypothetical protein